MTIDKNVNGDITTLKINGRLDSTTAPDLETVVDNCVTQTKELILDCSNLEYIASAGLRIILKAQKAMTANGKMKLLNVNDTVMEILDITGFSNILTIE